MSDEEVTEWSNLKTIHADQFVETKKTNFDIESLHPEARRRLQMLGFLTVNADGEQEEVSDEQIDAILLKRRSQEDPDLLADKYMMQHGLYDLFKTLTTKIVLNRPADPVAFVISDLEKRMKEQEK